MTEKKLVHLYDPKTKEYLGSQIADLDPMATEREGKSVYMLPANATFLAPPKNIKANTTVIYENEKWKLVPDYRGQFVADKNLYIEEITQLGSLPEGFVLVTNEQREILIQDNLRLVWTEKGFIENSNYKQDKAKREKDIKKAEIIQELNTIDLKTIRALRAGETDYLKKYEEQAEALRQELKLLG